MNVLLRYSEVVREYKATFHYDLHLYLFIYLFAFYLKTLSVSQTSQRLMLGWIINNKLERV